MSPCGNLEHSEEGSLLKPCSCYLLSVRWLISVVGPQGTGEKAWRVGNQMVSSLNASLPPGSPPCYNLAEPISTRN